MFKVVVDYAPSQSDNDIVREGLIKSYEDKFGERDKQVSIFLKNDSGKVFGGIQAFMDTESIYIDVMWVEENFRKQGYGAKLLGAAEREAIKKGCLFSLVDTWDFQAEEFYLKNGYERIGEIKNYWHGHSKLFLRKKLNSSNFHFSPAISSQNGATYERFIESTKEMEHKMTGSDLRKKEGTENLLIRPMTANDIAKIVSRYTFPWSTPEKSTALWNANYQEQQEKIRTVAVIEKNGEILGYGSLLRKPECPFFTQKNIPEINAIWIDEEFRRKGLGTALIKWLENLASQESYKEIGIGVGLYRDYGPAQQLYSQLGYIPEGNGITYKGLPTVAGETYPLDDDLILWLCKALK